MPTSIIPRKILFSDPLKISPKISPEGRYLAFIAPKNDILNVYVSDNLHDLSSAKAITNDEACGIKNFWWSFDHQIVYSQDKSCNGDFKLYSFDVETDEEVTLIPFDETRSEPIKFSQKYPDEVVVSINHPDPTISSLYRVHLKNGENNLIEENTQAFQSFFVDDDFEVCFSTKITDEGGKDIYRKVNGEWELMISYEMDDAHTSEILSIVKENFEELIYLTDSRDRKDFNALYKINLNDPEKKLHVVDEPSDQRSDITNILLEPSTHVPLAYTLNHLKTTWNTIPSSFSSSSPPKILEDLDFLKETDYGNFSIVSQTLDNNIWIVCFENDAQSVQYYLYNRDQKNKSIHLLFNLNPELENFYLTNLFPVVIKSRDGLDLVSYLTLPPKKMANCANCEYKPTHPLPMILNVHDGPWERDSFALRMDHQYFANRGYVVLSVNYRGSCGFGKRFLCAGNGEWGSKIQEDLADAVKWAIGEGIALEDKIAIYGNGYGGYAALMGLVLNPDMFAIGIDAFGPPNLVTYIESIPSYWKPWFKELTLRVGGNPETEEGVEFLKSRSPLTHVDSIKKPLLVFQGKNDPRVKESDQIVSSLVSRNDPIPVVNVLYNDEGHGISKAQNRISFYAIVEKFLSKYLYDHCNQFEETGEDFECSNFTILNGEELIQ